VCNHTTFEQQLGCNFRNKKLLMNALTHRSYLNEHRGENLKHNERLEFFGDAVIELIVTEFLYNKYPEATEGELTKFRSALVSTVALAELGEALGVYAHLLLSHGQQKDSSRARQHIVASAYEAIVGALYLDQGKDETTNFVTKTLLARFDQMIAEQRHHDAKSLLQEEAQGHIQLTPIYKVTEEHGPDHDKCFIVGVFLDTTLIATGKGASKKVAEENAAKNALSIPDWKNKATST